VVFGRKFFLWDRCQYGYLLWETVVAVEIIAEVAQGFEGNAKLAELLALGAIRAGADAVKYQLVFADELCTVDYPYYDFFKSLEMDEAVWEQVVSLGKASNKQVYFDVYGDRSLCLAKKLGATGVKISTTDFYNQTLIDEAFKTFARVFISIGGVALDELDEMLATVVEAVDLTLMHGFQAEPTPIEENNLLRIATLKARYPNISIGFMDHSLGSSEEAFYLPLMAVSLGATCIEKHITLDPLLEIEDCISALEPQRYKKFVEIIHKMEQARGSSDLVLTTKEMEYKSKAGKVVVAKRDLKAGEILRQEDLTLKRAYTDGSPNCLRKLLDLSGKVLKQDVMMDSPLTKEMI